MAHRAVVARKVPPIKLQGTQQNWWSFDLEECLDSVRCAASATGNKDTPWKRPSCGGSCGSEVSKQASFRGGVDAAAADRVNQIWVVEALVT
jgi:hypothetical protein